MSPRTRVEPCRFPALALAAAAICSTHGTLAADFQRQGTYIYQTADRVLGTETFSTVDVAGGHEVRSRTDLDLGGALVGQSSILRVGEDGAFQSVTLAGEIGGKPFGLHAEAGPSSILVRDTLTGAEEETPLAQPVQWITGNFMQHVIYLLSRYDVTAGGPQAIPTQAGLLVIQPLGPATLYGPDGELPVEHRTLFFLEETMEVYLDAAGRALLFILPDQGVRVRLQGFEGWSEAPIATSELETVPLRAAFSPAGASTTPAATFEAEG